MRFVQIFIATILVPAALHAQLPPEVADAYFDGVVYPIDPNTQNYIPVPYPYETDMVSNGQGHHLVMRSGGQVKYYRFNGLGAVIGENSFGTSAGFPSITTYFDPTGNGQWTLHVVFRGNNAGGTPQLKLFKSLDAGVTWTEEDFRTITGTISGIDSYEDGEGTHIVYGNGDGGIYYHMRGRNPEDWKNFPATITSSGAQPCLPSLTATAESVFVVRADKLSSLKLQTGESWVHNDYSTLNEGWGPALIYNSRTDLPTIPYLHVFPWKSDWLLWFHYRKVDVETNDHWIDESFLDVNVEGGTLGWKAHGVVIQSQIRLAYSRYTGGPNRVPNDIVYNVQHREGNTNFSGISVEINEDGEVGVAPVIGGDLGSVAVIWRDGYQQDGRIAFRRKPLGISSTIYENYDLYGTNWIPGEATLQSNRTLRLKSGSTTYIWGQYTAGGPGNLVISSGASLIIEADAQLILKPPTQGTASGGQLELGDNVVVTVPHTALLEAQAGTQLKFGNAARLNIEGEIKAIGTGTGSSQKVLFTRLEASDVWNGIVIERPGGAPKGTFTYATIEHVSGQALRVGANAIFTMENSTITNAPRGIEFTEAVPPLGAPMNLIKNCTITLPTGVGVVRGIISTNYSNFSVEDNDISTPSTSLVSMGILLYASNPQIKRNNITGFGRGIMCLDGSSPIVGGTPNKLQMIFGRNTGVYCSNASNPVLGSGTQAGLNCIGFTDQSGYDIQLFSNCDVLAQKNNWEESIPDPDHFNICLDDCTLDYTNHLEACLPPLMRIDGGNPVGGGTNPELTLVPRSLLLAMDERAQGNYREAISLLQEVIPDEEVDLSAREWAISELFACVQSIPGSTISDYLESTLRTSPELERRINIVLPHVYLHEGLTETAMAAFNANLEQYPNSEIERAGIYGQFLNALYANRDPSSAQTRLGSLRSLHPESDELLIAEQQLQDYIRNTEGMEARSESGDRLTPPTMESNQESPKEFSLSQSYPNPFNPSTTIEYALPDAARVSLKVYDLLGREVLSLVDGFKEAGYHQVKVDGSNLASGIYFYRIAAGSFTDVKKFILVR